jgi:hypothetical protein
MAIAIEVITNDIALATEWRDLRVTETIGEPDRLSVAGIGFTEDAGFTQLVVDLFAPANNYFYTVVKLDDAILFSGLSRIIGKTKPTKGVVRYSIQADGWQFLAPKRLVGVPGGFLYLIQEDGDPDRLPTAVAVDPNAIGAPNGGSVTDLWQAYWVYPAIDLLTYVTDILPLGATEEQITWSGSDLEGVTSDLAAAGSAAALWWLANDSPDAGDIVAPHLALHFGLVVMPDDGDEGDDLLAGFPSADPSTLIAPYEIDNETPNGTTRIMPSEMEFEIDHSARDDAVYVRGATGFSEEIIAAGGGGYTVGDVVIGGTGWVGSPAGIWGEVYLDAPAAVTRNQRDAFGLAYLASRDVPRVTGTIKVVAYDGWHKGQGVRVTDADYGYDQRWFLIRSVEMTCKSPLGDANEYTLTVGDTLSASLGYALRQQRLAEQRKEIRPATRFIPYVGDLQLDPGETAPLTMQLANDGGKAMAVAGVPARWGLLVNGVDLTDPEDTAGEFFLTNLVLVTDELGQITATLNANAAATADDAAKPWAVIAL